MSLGNRKDEAAKPPVDNSRLEAQIRPQSEPAAVDNLDLAISRGEFEIYVDDARYSVPTLHLLAGTDEAHARRTAEAYLADSDHHRGVELWQAGRRILTLGAEVRTADRA